jgi:hypothetical protein
LRIHPAQQPGQADSLALVAENGREFYVELVDVWREEDCSDFVKKIVLPQLWSGSYSLPIIEARKALLDFLTFLMRNWKSLRTLRNATGSSFASSHMTRVNGPEMLEISQQRHSTRCTRPLLNR